MKSLSIFLLLFLSACAITPPEVEREKLPPVPVAFREGFTTAAPAEAQPRGEWWKAFSDPLLDELVERAGRNNASIQVAAARLQQARALVRATDADRAPQVGVGAGVVRERDIRTGNRPQTVISAGADLSYEVDLFGRLAAATDAATLDAQSREALLQSTRLLVQASVAQTYLALRAVDAERALVRETVLAYRDTLRLTERRYQAGDVAELDVARVNTEVAATES